jgi:tetratricopeptide (TPR) repeat protein
MQDAALARQSATLESIEFQEPPMPGRFPFRMRALAIAASALLLAPASWAQRDEATHSELDARLFYQLLIGELELRNGQAGTAYEVVLDAARRTGDEQLFRRATEIALHARAGDQALAAAQAWRVAVPASLDAHRYVIQLLVALQRSAETVEPMRSLLNVTPAAERPGLIMSLPRFFGRNADRKQVAGLLQQVLQPYADKPATRAAVNVALGRAWLAAKDDAKAIELARRAHADDPQAVGPAMLALEMMPATEGAEPLVLDHLRSRPTSDGVRMVYARVLATSQRYADAIEQLEAVTAHQPTLAPPWLTLGALKLELRQYPEGTAALQRYVQLVQDAAPDAAGAASQAAGDTDDDTSRTVVVGTDAGLTQAWLMLAQAAEQQGDLQGAEAWLAKIDNPQRALEVVTRRASLLARQGKLDTARELIRSAPAKGEDDERAKVLAEVGVLREVKYWAAAKDVLVAANRKYPDDADLLYEQAMMDEKLDQLDEMESLLRRVIALKPDYQHAYNALGYSLAERNLRLPEAKALIQKALDLAPGEPFITDSMGWVEYRIGNREQALRLLRGAYQSRPDPEIAAHLGEVLWVSGKRDEARKVWREGRSKDSTNEVLRETLARLQVSDL